MTAQACGPLDRPTPQRRTIAASLARGSAPLTPKEGKRMAAGDVTSPDEGLIGQDHGGLYPLPGMIYPLDSSVPTVPAPSKAKARRGTETRKMVGRIPIRLTDGERIEAEAAATAAGLSIGDYLRREALSEPDQRGSGAHVTRRSNVTFLRVTEEQRSQIEQSADRAGLSTGSYIRARGLKRSVTLTTRRPPVEKAELARLLGAIGRIKGNLYQLVRGQNFGREVPAVDAQSAIEAVETAAREIIRSLGRQSEARASGRKAG